MFYKKPYYDEFEQLDIQITPGDLTKDEKFLINEINDGCTKNVLTNNYKDVTKKAMIINNEPLTNEQVKKKKELVREIEIYKNLKQKSESSNFLVKNEFVIKKYTDDEEIFYLVYLKLENFGIDLRKKLKNYILEIDLIFDLSSKMFNCIDFIHQNNYIHSDIKLDNFLIDEENNIKIIDFGCCKSEKENIHSCNVFRNNI